ncbi:unnamed protein product, partial [Pelagomonas calceolata]
MTDSNIYTARDAWLANPTAAEATYGHISTWETGGVTDMSYLFCASSSTSGLSQGCKTAAASFNEDIGAWDTSGVTTMDYMFYKASAFDQDLSDWRDLGWCLDGVYLWGEFFGTPCASTSCGTGANMATLVCGGEPHDDSTIQTAVATWLADATGAEATYGHISTWETSRVTDMSYLFRGASSFDEDIGAWDTSGVITIMYEMFKGAYAFDQDLGWCVDYGVSLYDAFEYTPCESTSCGVTLGCPAPTPAPTITHPPTYTVAPTASPLVAVDGYGDNGIRTAVASWSVSNPAAAIRKYGHISTWQTGGVTDMSELFCTNCGLWIASNFNEDISAWDTSGVTDMKEMFYKQSSDASSFNQDLSGWDVVAVTRMGDMFKDAKDFDQDLGWCLDNDVGLKEAFKGTKCESTSCGVAQKDVIGICDPQCIMNSPTIAIALVVLLAGFGACVYWRKKKDETYVAAARRLLYSCLCCCCLCCRKKKEPSGINS